MVITVENWKLEREKMKKTYNFIYKYKGIILYLLFGGLTTVINLVVYNFLYYYWELSNLISTIIAWVLTVLTAFFTNKELVFGSTSWKWEVLCKEGLRFFECRVGTGILEIIFMYITVDLLAWSGFVMKIIANVIVIILNYVASKILIFRNK